ncbi:hypothetical protein DXM29_24190 [Agrobacterium tumefaciens]|nr:hypothetical protein DXM29_24190 [Agrobacterium tumefaciens]
MFDPVWLVNIVILALLDCTANAKGAFHPRQEQPNITSLTDLLRRPHPRKVEELEAHPLLLARCGLLDACNIALHDWIRLETEILGSFIEAVRLP